jgi:hypothetical protein
LIKKQTNYSEQFKNIKTKFKRIQLNLNDRIMSDIEKELDPILNEFNKRNKEESSQAEEARKEYQVKAEALQKYVKNIMKFLLKFERPLTLQGLRLDLLKVMTK